MRFQVRTSGNPLALASALHGIIREIAPRARLLDLRSMDDAIDRVLTRERALAQLSSFFAIFATLLAGLGLYGSLAFGVQQRTREIGIRMALGAQVRDVLLLIGKQGIGLVLLGCALGMALAAGMSQFVASLLFGVSPVDGFTLVATTGTMVLVTLAACVIPARRAARVSPLVALHAE